MYSSKFVVFEKLNGFQKIQVIESLFLKKSKASALHFVEFVPSFLLVDDFQPLFVELNIGSSFIPVSIF